MTLPFVADGHERARRAIDPDLRGRIEAEVRAEFSERLSKANRLQRALLELELRGLIRARIAAAIEAQAPRGRLY